MEEGFFPSADMQSVYSTVPADWAIGYLLGVVALSLCGDVVGVFYNPIWQGNW